MKNMKKGNIVVTVFFFTALLMSLAATASAQDEGTCSAAGVAGKWGYTETGTVFAPPSGAPVPFASVGRYTLDRDGNLLGTRVGIVGGTIQPATVVKGTARVNSDCTGTITIGLYDESGNLRNSVVKALVYVDNAREARAIITSISVGPPGGPSVPTVITMNARKLFPNSDNEQ